MAGRAQHIRKKIITFKDEGGMTLVESLITVTIVGVALTVFAVALSTGALAVSEGDREVTAQSLARSQMEYIKNYPYDINAETYPEINTSDNYSISVGVSPVADPAADNNIQKVTANISRDGELLLTIEDYKVNR